MTALAIPVRTNRPGVRTVYVWELRKLAAQKRTYIGLGCALLVPLIFIASLLADDGGPEGIPFGNYVRESGLAIPLVGLFFGAFWFFPLITALVAGDIVAAEDGNGTLKTILTRSLERGQVFSGKLFAALTYAIAAIFLNGAVSLVAGVIASGFNPLVSLSGTTASAPRGLLLVALGLLVYLVPIVAVACVGVLLSTITRNSTAAVVGTLMFSLVLQLIGILPGLGGLHPYLLSTQFDAWQGLLRQPVDWQPIVRSLWVCSVYPLPAVTWAYLAFL